MRMLTWSCLALLSTGCSFIFVRPPPSGHEQLAYFDCTSSDAAPATDVTNAVVDGLLVIAASADNSDGGEDDSQTGFATGVGIVGAVYAASAIYGFIMTSRCEDAKAQLAERVHKVHAERDELLKARTAVRSEPAGCRRDADCKGERLCVNAMCVNPPPAPPPAAPALPAAPPTTPAAPSSATP